jgi:hypothetical protein
LKEAESKAAKKRKGEEVQEAQCRALNFEAKGSSHIKAKTKITLRHDLIYSVGALPRVAVEPGFM